VGGKLNLVLKVSVICSYKTKMLDLALLWVGKEFTKLTMEETHGPLYKEREVII
jgi:hypothetical protein